MIPWQPQMFLKMSVWTCGSKNNSLKSFSLYSSVTSKVRSWECLYDPPTGFSCPRQCYPAHQKHHYLWVECVKQQTLAKGFAYPSYGQRLVKIFASWKPKSPRGWPVQHHVLWHNCLVLFSLLFLKVELASSEQPPLIGESCAVRKE